MKICEAYLLEDPFMDANFWWGNGKWGQSSDTPWKLAGLNWSQNAINNQSAFGFSRVLEAFSQANIGLAYEGALIHKMLTINNSAALNNLNHLTFEELGRLFDFKHYGNTQLWLTFSPYALSRILNIEDGNNNYDWHLFWDTGFKLEALRAILGGGYVDFEDKILSYLPICLENVFKDVQNINQSDFRLVIETLDNTNENNILNFNWKVLSVNSLSNNQLGTTDPFLTSQASGNFAITRLNWQILQNSTDLLVATTLIHEAYHAYLISYIKTVLPPLYNSPDFENYLYRDMIRAVMEDGIGLNQAQHEEFINDNIVNVKALSLLEYAQNKGYNVDYSFCEDLVWGAGLQETTAFNNNSIISPNRRQRIRERVIAEKNSQQFGDYIPKGQKACN